MSVQQFCLRWNNHQPNFISVFSSLLHNEALVDVTLAAEGRQLQAHKVVLSACSSYFQSLFTTNPCQHPIVILKDVQYNDLKTMVDFMYYGEVNVSQEQLPHILKTAEMLKIKGLAEMPDPATLTKSESKTSSDHTDQAAPNSSGESMWGSTESQQQFHQQQQQQQQQQQARRTPTPGAMSPSAARRKRLRKSSTGSGSASTERTSEEYSSIEGPIGLNMTQSQIEQISAFGSTPTNLSQQNINNPKMLKESCSTEELQQPESSHESVDVHHSHQHIHQNVIKADSDISAISQQMPIDITSPTTPSEHGSTVSCSQPQTPHSGIFFPMGTKRGRLLIRQPRVKRDSDPFSPQSPEMDVEPSITQRFLTIPHPKIERHASEPTPNMTISSSHLLPVPQTSFLVKQHSHPLLLQTTDGSSASTTHFTLQRQLSYPTNMDSSIILPITSTQVLSSPPPPPPVTVSVSTSLTQYIERSLKVEDIKDDSVLTRSGATSPAIVVVTEPLTTTCQEQAIMPSIRVKGEELQRSISSPQPSRTISLEAGRSLHCPVIRPGPALGCNFCWNTIDAHGRILRRKTKYHCPECQTNLCIVPCFQEYHERQSIDGGTSNDNIKTQPIANLRQYPKTGSL